MPSGHISAGNFERPLSDHAWNCLASAARNPYPAQDINFGVADKLIRMGYAKYEHRSSPYKTHKPGQTVQFLVVTDYGNFQLQERARKRA